MQDQDKMEDIFDALNIDLNQKPYFPHFAFFLCLAVIKRNNYDETKDQIQLRHFIKCVKYIKLHYKSLIKTALISGNEEDVKIPLSFGLYRGPRQRYTYRVLQTIQMKLLLLCVWAEQAVLGSSKTALKFKYEI